jgi:hypothetical protein
MSAALAGQPPGIRLTARTNPLRLAISPSLWRSAWYLLGYVFVTGWVLATAALLAAGTAAIFAITIAGIPLLTGAAGVVRGCANVERARARPLLTGPLRGRYEPVVKPGILAQATTRWRDRATWRDLAYLVGMWVPLAALDTIVLTLWLTCLIGITIPVWYWAPTGGNAGIGYSSPTTHHGLAFGYFPHGPHGRGAEGIFVDSLPSALGVAAIFLVLFLAVNYLLVLTARAHVAVARGLLGPPEDPLAAAKDVLARPGPLPPLAATPSAATPGPGAEQPRGNADSPA